MSIDTNSFITKYIKAVQEQLHFEKEIEKGGAAYYYITCKKCGKVKYLK